MDFTLKTELCVQTRVSLKIFQLYGATRTLNTPVCQSFMFTTTATLTQWLSPPARSASRQQPFLVEYQYRKYMFYVNL